MFDENSVNQTNFSMKSIIIPAIAIMLSTISFAQDLDQNLSRSDFQDETIYRLQILPLGIEVEKDVYKDLQFWQTLVVFHYTWVEKQNSIVEQAVHSDSIHRPPSQILYQLQKKIGIREIN